MESTTFYIAIYGAILSTIVFGWELFKYFSDKPKIKVVTNFSIPVGGLQGDPMLGIDIINTGKRPVTIISAGFELIRPAGEPNMATILEAGLPRELFEGQHHSCFAQFDAVNLSEVKRAFARDATGTMHCSKKKPFSK